ncbi:unnamed protein product [Lepeophtheirus salmonis]|uniref:(salmon louse) hypothetical protein n=1 Tax=Lepeophtheirus salmonis TaxID=72036 RepID=A0A7R8D4K3_LEPSM|nr:unnamed protein product [Lepeophtheirus salmonis]CAF2973254.1 unnamed protein product [Lepeophtheirus salmonis]
MNKLKAGAAAASANNSIINNNNNTPSNKQGGGKNSSSRSNKKTSNLTVASLLSKHRNGNNHNYHSNHPALSSHHSFASQEEVEKAEKSVSANPELTIEPIYKPTRLSGSASGNSSNKEWKKSSQSDDSKNSTTHNEPQSQVPSSQDYSEKDDECGVEDDGKLKIKNVNESPEIRNLSDQDTDEEESECGNDVGGSSSTSSSLPSVKNNNSRMSDLRLPLDLGWKRESLVREYSKSGFRGDIFYYAPCGKKFKQYSDILRYLEKRDIKELQREHFSFSTKILIGEFLKPTGQAENGQEKYLRLNEREMYKDLEVVKKENGWSKGNKKEEKQQQILLETLQQNQKRESSDALMHRDAMELLKEAERVERALKEKELKKIQEEAIKQRALENNIKMHEREMKRQQALIIKEQERERRRQHMIFMKLLEGKRRSDERERRREDLRVEKEKDRERRIEQRRLEYEIITELKKPCEDMSLIEEAKPIPNFERMNGMSLSGEAFANVLMIHEFVHNFGDTLGFDVEALPTLPSLQSAMLNDPEFEEELLSIVIHLVVCAIEDPGIPNPNKHLTIMGQSLRQADITNTNITEILKIYLHARAQAEVKACHGAIPPPEFFHQNSSGPIHHLSHYHYYKDKKTT